MDDIKFPMLFLDEKNGVIVSIKNKKKYHITGEKIVLNRSLIGCTLVDANGFVQQITNVIKTGWGNPFWGYSLFYNQRSVKVDYRLKKIKSLDLTEFKMMVIKNLETQKKQNKDTDSDSYLVANELIEAIKKSNSFNDIIIKF